jgi:hypothetical protein
VGKQQQQNNNQKRKRQRMKNNLIMTLNGNPSEKAYFTILALMIELNLCYKCTQERPWKA